MVSTDSDDDIYNIPSSPPPEVTNIDNAAGVVSSSRHASPALEEPAEARDSSQPQVSTPQPSSQPLSPAVHAVAGRKRPASEDLIQCARLISRRLRLREHSQEQLQQAAFVSEYAYH